MIYVARTEAILRPRLAYKYIKEAAQWQEFSALSFSSFLFCIGMSLHAFTTFSNFKKAKSTMIKSNVLLLSALLLAQSHSGLVTAAETASASKTASSAAVKTAAKTKTITAQFVDFSFGDTSHYIFQDQAGKTWDFGGNRASGIELSRELPANEANESNQGWAANKKMVSKWFKLTYEVRTMPLYQDGPMGKVQVIVDLLPVGK